MELQSEYFCQKSSIWRSILAKPLTILRHGIGSYAAMAKDAPALLALLAQANIFLSSIMLN
jgi:hypothetical protein